MGAWKFWIAVGVFVTLMWGLAYCLKKRRTAALRTVAEQLGFQFNPQGGQSLVDRLAGFDLLSRHQSFGASPIRNLLRREADGRRISLFDHRVRKPGNNPVTITILLLESEEFNLPPFVARPESVFQKLGSVMGTEDIDFPDYPEFSRKFVLSGEDEQKIRQVMTEEVIHAFERHTGLGVSGISVEGRGHRLIVYYFLRRVSPGKLQSFFTAGLDIAEALTNACREARDGGTRSER